MVGTGNLARLGHRAVRALWRLPLYLFYAISHLFPRIRRPALRADLRRVHKGKHLSPYVKSHCPSVRLVWIVGDPQARDRIRSAGLKAPSETGYAG
jgi:hypothetical protein